MFTQGDSANSTADRNAEGRSGGATRENKQPEYRRERERLAVIEAQIAQTCYELSRLRGEHRRLRSRLALLEATGMDFPAPSSDPE